MKEKIKRKVGKRFFYVDENEYVWCRLFNVKKKIIVGYVFGYGVVCVLKEDVG